MTKKQLINSYEWAFRTRRATELHEVYKCASTRKYCAMQNCKAWQYDLKGYDATIVGASSHFFHMRLSIATKKGKND